MVSGHWDVQIQWRQAFRPCLFLHMCGCGLWWGVPGGKRSGKTLIIGGRMRISSSFAQLRRRYCHAHRQPKASDAGAERAVPCWTRPVALPMRARWVGGPGQINKEPGPPPQATSPPAHQPASPPEIQPLDLLSCALAVSVRYDHAGTVHLLLISPTAISSSSPSPSVSYLTFQSLSRRGRVLIVVSCSLILEHFSSPPPPASQSNMSGANQPYMYNRFDSFDDARFPASSFDPKAVTRSSWEPRPAKPRHEGPLVSFNRHPE